MADDPDFKPATQIDPNAWYHLTEDRADDPNPEGDFNGILVVDNPDNGTIAVFNRGGDHWQFQPVDTDDHDARYAIRCSSTNIYQQLSVCYREEEIADGSTRPCMAESDGSDEQKWDIARWSGTDTFRFINVANGTEYWMDCHRGNPPFMNPEIETSVERPAQHWIMSSVGPVDDGEFSTTFTNTPSTTSATTGSPGPSDPPVAEEPGGEGDNGGGLSAGAAAGVGVGVGLAVIGLAVALFLFWRRRRRRGGTSTAIPAEDLSPSTAAADLNGPPSYQQRWDGGGYAPPYEQHKPVYHEVQSDPAPQELSGDNTYHHEMDAGNFATSGR